MEPGLEPVPENLNADVCINPQVLATHPSLHQPFAELVQMFLERIASPLARHFTALYEHAGWSTSGKKAGGSRATVIHQKPSAHENSMLPLIPAPAVGYSTSFSIPGRPAGSLQRAIISARAGMLSNVLKAGVRMVWAQETVQVYPYSPAESLTNTRIVSVHPATPAASPRAMVPRQDAPSTPPSMSVLVTPAIGGNNSSSSFNIPATPESPTIRRAHTRFESVHKPAGSKSGRSNSGHKPTRAVPMEIWGPADGIQHLQTRENLYPDVSSLSLTPSPDSNTNIAPRPSSYTRRPRPLESFGPNTTRALKELNFPDKVHHLCLDIHRNYLMESWSTHLLEADSITINPDGVGKIVDAMVADCE
ncbi:hypothetical protein BJ138DRAFT_1120530 [Hygrophoropsis aurantiaca]|uniref:Uncharacterized protein n=1 Tax=Hygrophoropsis aurantiaca TaxID=72124 RepID=A0ACB7ZQ15_9AGAM|nr:hypothetical protein BJ138DRAFT_1120530 [Hygrophoropsis aurantiaca]